MYNSFSNSLSDSRIQIHWAAQTLSSAADATLEKANDDSHSNLGWDTESRRLVGRIGSAIDVEKFSLVHRNESLLLRGKTLGEAMEWLGERTGKTLRPREYDMPAHAVADGAAFDPAVDDLVEIANWFDFGSTALANHGGDSELRTWPHHFDLGFFMTNVSGSNSIGGGFSVGDNHYEMPYIYVNPYGIENGVDNSKEMPDVAPGFWTDKWLGAVITFEQFGVDGGQDIASSFTKRAIESCKKMFDA